MQHFPVLASKEVSFREHSILVYIPHLVIFAVKLRRHSVNVGDSDGDQSGVWSMGEVAAPGLLCVGGGWWGAGASCGVAPHHGGGEACQTHTHIHTHISVTLGIIIIIIIIVVATW